MSKYYAVKQGYKIGIFDNWEECKESVNGFKGAQYKSFRSEEEALKYLDQKSEKTNFVK
jgi:ribonuclease H-related protein